MDEIESSFAQVVFNEMLKRHPQLEPYQKALAEVVGYTVRQTHIHTRRYMMDLALDALGSFYDSTKKRRDITKKLLRSIKRNPGMVHRNAVLSVEQVTLATLANLGELPDDEAATRVGNA